MNFIDEFNNMSALAAKTAEDHGWVINNDGEAIALMHSELSECLEFLRHDNPKSDKISEFSGAEEELADVIIRIMHYSWLKNLRVAEALIAKMKFNEQRPYKHGGKLF